MIYRAELKCWQRHKKFKEWNSLFEERVDCAEEDEFYFALFCYVFRVVLCCHAYV